MSENSTNNLTEKERNIVDLINKLSDIANDETSAKETIESIVSKIQGETAANIKEELAKADNYEDEQLPQESVEMKNAVRRKMDDIREKSGMPPLSPRLSSSDGNTRPAIISFGSDGGSGSFINSATSESGKSLQTNCTHQVFFTRIREVKSPCKAHPTDAGIDFFVPDAKAWTDEYKSMVRSYSRNPFEQDLVFIGVNGVEVAPGAHVAIPSGIKTIIPTGLAMMMVNKSGVATKLKLDHSACLIDSEYRDELIFCFFNNNQERIVIEPGMKLTQGLIVPVYNVQMQEVLNCVYDDLGSQTNRGGGFGSSGCC